MMRRFFLFCLLLPLLAACSEMQLASHITKQALPDSKSQGTFKVGSSYTVGGRRYTPRESYDLVETGIASWYGADFHRKKTANGETFDMYELTAAHRTLQMPSLVRVTNLENGRSLVVRVNDRGPYKRGRVMDVSMRAAELLGFKNKGTAKIRLEVLKKESLQIAQAAKAGRDTSGYEVPLNRGGTLPASPPSAPAVLASSAGPAPQGTGTGLPGPVTEESLPPAPVAGHMRGGQFYPDPVVTERPVTHTDIFVQAGSFTVADNAYRMSVALERYGAAKVYPAMVGGRQYYRVRLGPVGSVQQADALLDRLMASGNGGAMIVVE